MNKIDYQVLREKAEKATWGDWDSYKPHRGARGYEVRLSSQAIAQHVLKNNAEFIAAFNPKVALALLDEREAQNKRIAELEEREILLPERSSMLHRTDFHDDYQTVMAYKVSEVIAAIRVAGIRIKGE
ncbi:ead/Ea22-like family protein [Escherichia coli]|uniref:ead/Ea22-like family protein n=1 Tax=Escherichia coli TaxID=562 RepID=UPI001E4174A4